MRIRTWLLAGALTAAAVATPTATAQAAAPQPFRAVVTCDATTNTFTVGTVGGSPFLPNQPIKVEFQTLRGSYVTAAGTEDGIYSGSTTTIPATAGPDGNLTMTGIRRAWPAANYVFYTEVVKVTARNAQNQVLNSSEGSCFYDLRTTVTITCDPVARTITASAAGARYLGQRPLTIEYKRTTVRQATKNSGQWIGTGHHAATHQTTTTAAGDWSDIGYSHPFGDNYHLSDEVDVSVSARVVTGGWSRHVVIGRGTAKCEYTSPTR